MGDNSEFVNGSIAEKARIANMLIAEVLAGCPDYLVPITQEGLHMGSRALQVVHDALRMRMRPPKEEQK